eukprot:15050223-Ditylum_brightwellii.AAC.1
MQQNTIDTIANSVSVTANDRDAVVSLTVSKSTLVAQIKTLMEHNTKHKEEMESLKSNATDILSFLQDTNLHNNSGNSNNSNNNRYCQNCNNRYQNCQQQQQQLNRIYCCWSHGVTNGEHHTSPTCAEQKRGHKDNTTILNK